MVPLAFSMLLDFGNDKMEGDDLESMRRALKARYDMISSDLHIFALVLDPFVPNKRYSEVSKLLDGRPVMAVAQSSLTTDLKFSEAAAVEEGNISRSLAMWVASDKNEEVNCFQDSYQPLVWWSTIGVEKYPLISNTAKRVFSMNTGSACADRSFKIRSRVHSKSRNRLGSSCANQQSSISLNHNQLERLNCGVLATKRGSSMELRLVQGFCDFVKNNIGTLAEIMSISSPTCSSDVDESAASEECDIDLFDDTLFGTDISEVDLDLLIS